MNDFNSAFHDPPVHLPNQCPNPMIMTPTFDVLKTDECKTLIQLVNESQHQIKECV